jgi:hypothetical protein
MGKLSRCKTPEIREIRESSVESKMRPIMMRKESEIMARLMAATGDEWLRTDSVCLVERACRKVTVLKNLLVRGIDGDAYKASTVMEYLQRQGSPRVIKCLEAHVKGRENHDETKRTL